MSLTLFELQKIFAQPIQDIHRIRKELEIANKLAVMKELYEKGAMKGTVYVNKLQRILSRYTEEEENNASAS